MATENLLRSALEMLPESLVIFGADARLVFANGRFLEAFELDRQEVDGLTSAALEALLLRKGLTREGGEGWASPSGHHFERRTSALAAGGRLDTYADVTKARRHGEQREQLLSVAIHDLRSPLANVRSYAGLLLGGRMLDLDPRVKRAAEVISRNADKALRLLQLYFDSLRAEGGTLTIDRQPMGIGPLLSDALAGRRAIIAEKAVTVKESISERLLILQLDRERVSHVVGTFLDNALFRAPNNGKVELATEERPAEIWVGFSDDGAVVPREEAALAFDRDHQVLKERRLGHGFALSVAQDAVQAHGGDTGVISGTGRTTFWFTLPR